MSSRFNKIYLGLAPVLFGLSWYISHRLHLRFMQVGQGTMEARTDDRSLIYAFAFLAIYLGAWLVIRDLYGSAKSGKQ